MVTATEKFTFPTSLVTIVNESKSILGPRRAFGDVIPNGGRRAREVLGRLEKLPKNRRTVRTFEQEQKRFIDEWWNKAVQIMNDVERNWNKVDEATKEGKEMIDLRKTVERVLLESLREIRLEKARKGRKRKKVETTPETIEEEVVEKTPTPVLKVSDILKVINHGGFVEVKTVPSDIVQNYAVPTIERGLNEENVKQFADILSRSGEALTYTVQFYEKRESSPYGIQVVRPSEQAQSFVELYEKIKDKPLLYSDGSVNVEALGELRSFVGKLEELLRTPSRRDIYLETVNGLRTLVSSLKAGRFSWSRRRRK